MKNKYAISHPLILIIAISGLFKTEMKYIHDWIINDFIHTWLHDKSIVEYTQTNNGLKKSVLLSLVHRALNEDKFIELTFQIV